MYKDIIPVLLLIILFFSCGEKDSANVIQERDNEIDVSELIEEFPVDTPLIHDGAILSGSYAYLYIKDPQSTDKFTSVFSFPDGKFVGQFMDFGEGPNEIAIIGSINLLTSDVDGREKLVVIDHGNYRSSIYDVDSALTDSAYIPRRIKPLDSTVFPSHYVYVNDTLGFARKIIITPGSTKFDQALGKYNLTTGELTDFAPEEHIADNQSLFTVSKSTEKIIEVGSNVDIVIIYDYDGNVVRRIKGPNYKPEVNRRKSYFTNVKIAGPYILGVYSGGDWITEHIGKTILVWDLEGNYIATLDTGNRVRDMYYHEPSGILWLSFAQSDMQFGKLNLEEALKKSEHERASVKMPTGTEKSDVVKKTTEKSEVNYPILTGIVPPLFLTSNDLKDTLTCLDMGEIRLPKERDDLYWPERCGILVRSFKEFSNKPASSERKIRLLLEPTKVTPDFVKCEFALPYFEENMFTFLEMDFTKDAPEGEFNGMVEVRAKGFSEPFTFPISGTIVYE